VKETSWKDISSYSRGDTERVPHCWELRAGEPTGPAPSVVESRPPKTIFDSLNDLAELLDINVWCRNHEKCPTCEVILRSLPLEADLISHREARCKAADPSPQASPEPRAALLSLLRMLKTYIVVREGHQQDYEEVIAAILVESRVTGQKISIEVFQQDWIPGFAAFYDYGSIKESAKAHIVLNLASFIASIETKDLSPSDLPYVIAESLMHEAMHVLESWANVEFSEERIEELLTKYREKYRSEAPRYEKCEPRETPEQRAWSKSAPLASPPQIAQPLNPSDCDCNHQHASHSFCRSKEPSRGMIPENERVYPAAQPSQVSAR
jgi:hypothetical protein